MALVSAKATFDPHYRAGEQSPQVKGRPGASCLGSHREFVVDERTLDFLRRMGESLGEEARKRRTRRYNIETVPDDDEAAYHFMGSRFVLGESFGVRSRCDPVDRQEVLRQVREAARQAEWVIVSVHNHE